jgi:putative addiction module CopG family antidote
MSKLRYFQERVMNVSLTPQLEKMIREKVESGMYNNASEVVREALRQMAERERHITFRASLDRSREQIAQGLGTVWTDNTMDEILREADEADQRGEPIRADVQP